MATTIINPTPNADASSNSMISFFLGGIVLIVLAVLFFVYAIPYIKGLSAKGIQVNLPKTVNVNVQQSK